MYILHYSTCCDIIYSKIVIINSYILFAISCRVAFYNTRWQAVIICNDPALSSFPHSCHSWHCGRRSGGGSSCGSCWTALVVTIIVATTIIFREKLIQQWTVFEEMCEYRVISRRRILSRKKENIRYVYTAQNTEKCIIIKYNNTIVWCNPSFHGNLREKSWKLSFLLTASLNVAQATATRRYNNTARMFNFAGTRLNFLHSDAATAFLYQTCEDWPISHHWYLTIHFCTATCVTVTLCNN